MDWGLSHPHWPWRDRKGNPITVEAVARLFSEEGFGLRVVGKTQVGSLRVSTVHLVVGHPCHGDGQGGPCQREDASNGWCLNAIYETMIFCDEGADGKWQEWDGRQWRYHTLAEAIRGHEAVLSTLAVLANTEEAE